MSHKCSPLCIDLNLKPERIKVDKVLQNDALGWKLEREQVSSSLKFSPDVEN